MHASEFRSIVSSKGLQEGIRALNQEAPHRYSAVFEFRGAMLHNLCLVDKLNPDIQPVGDQSIAESYCIYVQRTAESVAIDDARADPRAEGHPKRGIFFSYYGVPLFSEDRRVLGTVCHFDERALAVPQSVADAMEDVAPLIVETAFGRNA
jgi:GAF domain-containing protein